MQIHRNGMFRAGPTRRWTTRQSNGPSQQKRTAAYPWTTVRSAGKWPCIHRYSLYHEPPEVHIYIRHRRRIGPIPTCWWCSAAINSNHNRTTHTSSMLLLPISRTTRERRMHDTMTQHFDWNRGRMMIIIQRPCAYRAHGITALIKNSGRCDYFLRGPSRFCHQGRVVPFTQAVQLEHIHCGNNGPLR